MKDKDKLAKKLPKIPAKKMNKKSDSTFVIEDTPSPEFVDEECKDKLYIIIDKKGGKKTTSKLYFQSHIFLQLTSWIIRSFRRRIINITIPTI